MPEPTQDLFRAQTERLQESHFLVLFWAAQAEDKGIKFNITNCFDDLKFHKITRTKQNAVAIVDSLAALCFLTLKDEGNRRNIYITSHGAKALQELVLARTFKTKPSAFLEGSSS